MDVAAMPKISADAHVDEPHNLWYDRLPAALRDKAPRRIQSDADGGWSLVVDGNPVGWVGLTKEEADELDRQRVAAASIDVRLDMLRTDHCNAEVIYPTIGLYTYNITEPDVGRASCEVYNDWILERVGGHPRIKVAAMLPTWTLDMALAEIDRVVGHTSVGALLLPLVGTPEWNLPEWEPLWSAITETGLPVVMHQGTGHDMLWYRGWGSATTNLLATQSMAPRAASLLACSGVLERHPDLHAIFVECNISWIAWAISTIDEYYQAHAHWSKPKLAELPSHYLRRQIHATFQRDPIGVRNRDYTGVECLLWGNDYPHPESCYPNSAEVLRESLAGVPADEAHAIVAGNALRMFGFAPAVLAEPVG